MGDDKKPLQKSAEEPVADWKEKSEEYLNAWKRAAADFENYKKRREREDQELITFAREVAVVKMLPNLEALEQALRHAPADDKFREWRQGVDQIIAGLDKSLREMGVEKIGASGQPFDHELHEAVAMVDDSGKSGQVIEVVAAGYRINGKVLRPAKVKVAK